MDDQRETLANAKATLESLRQIIIAISLLDNIPSQKTLQTTINGIAQMVREIDAALAQDAQANEAPETD